MAQRKGITVLFVLLGGILALIATAGFLGPYLLVDEVERRMQDYAMEENLALSYSSLDYNYFSTTFKFKDFQLKTPFQKGFSTLQSPKVELSVSLWRYLFGSGYSYLRLDFDAPIITLALPPVISDQQKKEPSSPNNIKNVPPTNDDKQQEQKITEYLQLPQKEKVPPPVLPPKVNSPKKPPYSQVPNDEYPTICFHNGEIYVAQVGGYALLASDLEGVFGPHTDISYCPLGVEGLAGTITGSPNSLVLPQLELPAEKLRQVIFPSLGVDFGNCSVSFGGVWCIGGQSSLDFHIIGTSLRVGGVGGDFQSVDMQAVYDGESIQMLSCGFAWGGAEWLGEGMVANLDTGEIYFRFATPFVSFNSIKDLVGAKKAGQFYVVGKGAMEIAIGGTLRQPQFSFRFQRVL